MLSYSQGFYQLKDKLQPLYDANEAAAVAHIFMEHITGLSKADRLIEKDKLFTDRQQQQFDTQAKELTKGRPVQYVTNSAWFMGREFLVNEAVLIPRPETEELVKWIVEDFAGRKPEVSNDVKIDAAEDLSSTDDAVEGPEKLRVLDIGSGSGCIGLSLAGALQNSIVTCTDISKEAVDVLKTNIEWVLTAKEKKAGIDNITIKVLDFLDEAQRNKQFGRYDIIVSNPPYIPVKEKVNMHKNVKDHEPHIALFVPDKDALVFYKAIAAFGKEHLRDNGQIYCELDAAHALECKALFEEVGYGNVELKKDIHDNWRMLKASL